MKLQSNPAIEQLIRDDFVQVIAEEMDKVAIRGGDSNQPNGLMLATGINSVAIGTNGGSITLDKVLDLKASVSTSNGDVSTCGFLTNSSVEGAISKLKDSNGSYHLSPYGTELGQQQIASRRLMISNNVPSTLTKGSSSNNCSALIYGDFSQLLLGMFGDLEIEVDIYSQFQSGGVQVRALQAFDVGVRQPSAFGVIADITT
tara:strand:- start:4 stop:609 length:606 start_codon:yes stop_codon:yes gene_type:complete